MLITFNLSVSKMILIISFLQVREVLAVCLSRPLVETEEFQEAEKGIRNMAREELLTVLQNVLDVLKGKEKVKPCACCLLNL